MLFRSWIETFWTPQAFPTRADLDRIAPNNPVFLTRADGHGAVANSAAFKIAGIDKTTESPFGGEIMKDKATGEPMGMLLDRAQALVGAYERAGYRLVAPPILQPAEPFLDLSGEDIRKRMYLTVDTDGRELCLRPEIGRAHV